MKRLSTALAAIALIGTPAFAADMPVKAPMAAPAPVYNWTGWYVGVNAGASFGNVKTDFNAPVTFSANVGNGPGSGTTGLFGSDTQYPSGFIGGGQIGYNWQYSPLIVVGLEADFQGASERDHNTVTGTITGFSFAIPGGATGFPTGSTALNYTTQIDWFGTVRGRIGYVWGNGAVMSYFTGGLAYGEVKINGTSTANGAFVVPFSFAQAISHSQVNTGWVVGYGTEGAIDFWGAHNWTWKIEGLYMDLGHINTTGLGGTVNGATFAANITTGPVTTHSHFTDGILRGGLNYRF